MESWYFCFHGGFIWALDKYDHLKDFEFFKVIWELFEGFVKFVGEEFPFITSNELILLVAVITL